METILNQVADLLFWGSVALIAWGAALALGHWLASIDVRAPSARGDRTRRTDALPRAPRPTD
jgi:hypothetical protein